VGYVCEYCPAGKYTLFNNMSTCLKCPDHSNCSGGYRIDPDSGYWNTEPHLEAIYKCLNEQSCKNKNSTTCEEGYEGILCAKCKGHIEDTD